jgi:hypothetical protein
MTNTLAYYSNLKITEKISIILAVMENNRLTHKIYKYDKTTTLAYFCVL